MSACICTKRGFLPRPPQRKRVLIECPADSMASIMRRVPNLKGRTEEGISTVAKVNWSGAFTKCFPSTRCRNRSSRYTTSESQDSRLHCPWSHHYIKLQSGNSNLGLPDSKIFWIIAPFASISSYTMLTMLTRCILTQFVQIHIWWVSIMAQVLHEVRGMESLAALLQW